MKSIYESIFPEDCSQYNDITNRYKELKSENFTEAFEIMKDAWELANRWNDIMSNVSLLAVEKNVKKTDLAAWTYARYRQMQLLHESARMIWRIGEEEAKYWERKKDGR